MMRKFKIYFSLLLVLLPVFCPGQGKFYTTKERLQNYGNLTTKVVLPGNLVLNEILQREVSAMWQITPYEFCTESEYESIKNDPHCFFLRMVTLQDSRAGDSGVVCLSLSKGGGTNRQSRDTAIHLIDLPVVSSPSMVSVFEETCFPAYIAIVQQFIVDAAESERVANMGLAAYTTSIRKARRFNIGFTAQESLRMLQMAEPDGAIAIVIGPPDANEKSWYYHMLIGTSDMKLYYYSRKKNSPSFTHMELKYLRQEK